MNNTNINQTTTTIPSLEIKIIYITHFVVITLIILFAILCGSVGFNCGTLPSCRRKIKKTKTKRRTELTNDIV